MRNSIFIVLLIVSSIGNALHGQESYEVEFENGRKTTLEFEYNNASYMSKWRIGASLFGYNRIEKQRLSVFLIGEYRVNPRLYFEAQYGFPVDIPLDGSEITKNDDSRFKDTRTINLLGHFALLRNKGVMKRSIDIDNNMSRDTTTKFFATIPMQVDNSLLLDFGVNSFRQPANILLENSNASDFGNYFIPTHNSISIQTGFSFYRAQSLKFETVGSKTIRHLRYCRIYANLLYSVVNSGDVYYKSVTGLEDKKVATGYKEPETNNIGFITGLLYHFDLRNTVHTGWIGFEYGLLPHVSVDQDKAASYSRSSEISFFSVKLGVTIGGKINS